MTIVDPEWDAHLERFPEATFYHTRIWARILAAAFPDVRDESHWIEVGNARAALPLHTWRRLRGLLATCQSSFPFLYGGPVPRRVGRHDLLAETLTALPQGRRSLVIVSNPFAPGEIRAPKGISIENDSTHLLRLPARYEDYWDGVLTMAKRSDMRRLAKKGVSVRVGRTREEVAVIYGFYRRSFARWGAEPSIVYPESLYQAMLDLGEERVRLYIAEHEERIIGGTFVIRWNRHVHYHAGYFDHEARSLRPNILLQERIIRDAIADGFHDYDFLPSGGNPGVEDFKESFGGQRTLIQRYGYRAPLHELLHLLRGRFFHTWGRAAKLRRSPPQLNRQAVRCTRS